LHFDQSHQLQQLENLRDAADSYETDQIRGLTVWDKETEGNDGDQVDPEPEFHIFDGNLLVAGNCLVVLVHNCCIENDHNIDDEEQVDN
jgi:hypothetical protein